MRRIHVPLLLQLAALSAAVPAFAQTPPDTSVDSAQHALMEMLSTATMGMLSADTKGSKITKDGDGFRVELPIDSFKEPPDAAVTLHATQQPDGSWNIESMTIPPKGEIKRVAPSAGTLRYSIGAQAAQAHVFADLSKPSTFDVHLKDVQVDSNTGPQHAHQIWETYAAKGTLVAEGDGRLTMDSTGELTNLNMLLSTEHNPSMAFLARRVTADVAVRGLDREKGIRLRKDFQGLMATMPVRQMDEAKNDAGPGPHPHHAEQMSPAMQQMAKDMMHALLDDATGLLRSVKVDETIEGVTINAGAGKGASLGSVVLAMNGDSDMDHLNMAMDLAANDIAAPAVPVAYAPYVPKHISLSNKFRGLPAEPLRALLRAAMEEHPDPGMLEQQAIALLSTPGTVVSIDPFSFDAGPLKVIGTARLVPLANGSLGGHVHVTATGMDELMGQMQGDKDMAQAMPMLFIAKGMAKPDGKSLMWDIDYDEGGVRINGAPFGAGGGGGGKPPRR